MSPRPHWAELPALDLALEEREQELKVLLDSPKTYVYVAGQERIQALLDKALSHIMGAKEKWERRKAELIAGRRWVELIY
ncbi:hypothetical protein Nhal_3160 [Nitrosococcus halophilus Nc 4]|uniref:Uncharacterized protein n=1 Tax=Nitrosococcus halophilus (strain Nc4) TaxID=472759 RepID=D5BZW5_NITHN|nr:hypothetical protein [Nitrosococcus halophilus]ADE16212.1 hypothetical protein Nhal_3160 [Nitrosococcus halophilus Nc 4]